MATGLEVRGQCLGSDEAARMFIALEHPVEMYPQPRRGEGEGACCRIAVSKFMQVMQAKYTDSEVYTCSCV